MEAIPYLEIIQLENLSENFYKPSNPLLDGNRLFIGPIVLSLNSSVPPEIYYLACVW
jgi:hypothetical protein